MVADNFNNVNTDNIMDEASLSSTTNSKGGHLSGCFPSGKCPIVNPQYYCTVILEYKTCLVPPLLEDSDIKHTAYVEAVIEKVCPGIVLICGVLYKKIKYNAILQCGCEQPDCEIYDEVPFECYVNAEEANEGDLYKITGCGVMCSFGEVENKGYDDYVCKKIYWTYKQKDIIKIAIRRCKQGS